jgi:diguanylate cyclase (GGDEF)-like protein
VKNPYKKSRVIIRNILYLTGLIFSILFLTTVSSTIIQNNYRQEAESNIDLIASSIETELVDYHTVDLYIEETLENSLHAVALHLFENEGLITNAYLEQLTEEFSLTSIMWISATGSVLNASDPDLYDADIGSEDPLYEFLTGSETALIEPIMESTVTPGKYYKTAYYKTLSGKMVQISTFVEGHEDILSLFSIQAVIDDIIDTPNILFARFVSPNYAILSHSDSTLIGEIITDEAIIEAIDSKTSLSISHFHILENIESFCVVKPIYYDDVFIGVLNIGFDIDYLLPTSRLINLAISATSVIVYMIIVLILLYGTKTQSRIYQAAYIDPVSGFYTRMAFETFVDEMYKTSSMSSRSFVLMNIDNFTQITGMQGLKVGDTILQVIAERLKSFFPADALYKLQEDDFIITMNHTDVDEVQQIAKKIKESVSEEIQIGDLSFSLTCTSALMVGAGYNIDTTEVIRRLTTTLREAKKIKRGSYMFYDEKVVKRLKYHNNIEKAIKAALLSESHKGLYVVFQPIVDIQNQNTIVGFEALTRLETVDLGNVPPSDFIPIAEDNGLIDDLDRFVLHQSCDFYHEMLKKGLNPIPISISVNASAYELMNPKFAEHVIAFLHLHEVPADHIRIELTESVLAMNFDRLNESLTELKNGGVKISIDDFGTGYSSLSYLKLSQIDFVKLDRAFVTELETSTQDYTIASAVVSIANTLGAEVIAEGVETEIQLKKLIQLGSHYAQGYYFSKPVVREAALKLLKDSPKLIK